jgi:membrane protease subunit HflC
MSIRNALPTLLGIVGIAVLSSVYTVDQRETGIKFKFREIVASNIEPGLHFKIPFINTVKTFSNQILTLDAKPERFLTSEKKYVIVDFFVKWRIADTSIFYRSTGGGRIVEAQLLLEQIMKDGLRNEFSRRSIEQALSEERGAIMDGLQDKSNIVSKQLGIDIVDVRVSRIDFPDSVSDSVFDRMRSERKQVAQDFRSRGKEEAERIKAKADRKSTIIEAEAYRDAEKVRGQGDSKAASVYASAYQKDAEFYAFYRSLGAYKKALGKDGDILVLEPDTEFFNYFKQSETNRRNIASFPNQVAPAPISTIPPSNGY